MFFFPYKGSQLVDSHLDADTILHSTHCPYTPAAVSDDRAPRSVLLRPPTKQVCLFVGGLLNVSATCRHTEIEVADPTFHLTQSQYTDTGPTSPSTDSITPGVWHGSHWSVNFFSHWYDSTPEKSRRKRESNPGSSALEADALTTRPTRQSRNRWI